MNFKVYYHCHGCLSDLYQSEFSLEGEFIIPLENSNPNELFKLMLDDIYSKFAIDIFRISCFTFHLNDTDGEPVNAIPF